MGVLDEVRPYSPLIPPLNIRPGGQVFADFEHDTDLDRMRVIGGAWAITAGVLVGVNGRIANDGVLPRDRHVYCRMRAVVPGVNTWNVAWLMPKWIDANNRIYILIHNNGPFTMEVAALIGGAGPSWFVATGLNTALWHDYEVWIYGNRIRIFVDGTEYIDQTHVNVGALTGEVALDANGSTCHFDNLYFNV